MKSWVRFMVPVLAVALVFTPIVGLAVLLPASGLWTEINVDGHGVDDVAASPGNSAMGWAVVDDVDNVIKTRIGTPASFVTASHGASGDDDPCIHQLGTDDSWGMVYRDDASDTAKWTRTDNGGTSWSTAVQVAGIVDTSEIDCYIHVTDAGSVLVAIHYDITNVIYSVRSTDGGVTWEAPDLIDGTVSGSHVPQYREDDGKVWLAYSDAGGIFIKESSNDGASFPITRTVTETSGSPNFMGLAYFAGPDKMVVVFEDGGAPDIAYSVTSADDGITWGPEILVYDATGATSLTGFSTMGFMQDATRAYGVAYQVGPNAAIVYASSNQGTSWSTESIDVGTTRTSNMRIAGAAGFLWVVSEDITNGGHDVLQATNADFAGFGGTGTAGGGGTGDPGDIDPNREFIEDGVAVVNVTTGTTIWSGDVSALGTNLIIRHDTTGQKVTTYLAQSLAAINTNTDADCDSIYLAVLAGDKNVAWVDCTSGGPHDDILIRSPGMGDPIIPSFCPSSVCVGLLDNLDESGDLPEIGELGEIDGFDIDYNYVKIVGDTAPGGPNVNPAGIKFYWTVAAGYAAFGGDVGVVAKVRIQGATDDEGEHVILASPFTVSDSVVDQMCTTGTIGTVDPDTSNDYQVYDDSLWMMAAADQEGGGKVWAVAVLDSIREDSAFGAGFNDLSIDTQAVFTVTGVSQPDSVACGGYRYLFGSSTVNKVKAYDGPTAADGGKPVATLWERTDDDVKKRSTAASSDGKIMAYANSTRIIVLDGDDGELLATLIPPAGDIRSLQLDQRGANLWAITSTNIARYDLSPATCGDGICEPSGPDIPDTTSTSTGTGTTGIGPGGVGGGSGGFLNDPGSGIPGVDFDASAASIGISVVALAWLFGIFLVLFLTVGMGLLGIFINGTFNFPLALLGAFLGIGMSVAFSLLPVWVPVILAVLGSAALVLGLRNRSG